MAILTPSDKSFYFPACPLTGGALIGAIARAQLTAEGAKGANRTLELERFSEIRPIHQATQSCQLSRYPVLLLPAPVLRVRSRGGSDGFGRRVQMTAWQTLEATDYTIDLETGAVHLQHSIGWGWNASGTQLQAEYNTGFDFASDSIEVKQIKAAVAAILLYQTLGAA